MTDAVKQNPTKLGDTTDISFAYGLSAVRLPLLNTLLFTTLSLSGTSLFAQDNSSQSIKVGEGRITPALRLDFVNVDNTFRTDENLVDSTGLIVSPSVSWAANRRLLEISAGYQGRYGAYSESVLNFDDHTLGLNVTANPHTRHQISGAFSITREHDELGTGQAIFAQNADEQIESTRVVLRTDYRYGAKNARGQLGTGLFISNELFSNLEEITEGDDNTVVRPYALFSYRVSPDTRLVTEARFGVFDFDEDRRDRDQLSFLTGFDFNPTARTGGRLRLGVTRDDFDTADVSDTTTFVADINVFYRLRSFSRIDLRLNRDLETIDNSLTGSGEVIIDDLQLSWAHEWSSRISSTARYRIQRFDRPCPTIDSRTDTLEFQVGVNIRRWISVGVSVSDTRRDVEDSCDAPTDSGAEDFDLQRFGLFLTTTL